MRPERAIGGVLVAVALSACAPGGAASLHAVASAVPSASVSPSRSASAAPSAASPQPTGASAFIDPSLLEILPEMVDGLVLERAPESDAVVAGDPVVVANGEAAATALAIDPTAGQFAHATVVRLRPGVMSDGFYRAWRDSFDDAACDQAGGVVRRAESEIEGRQAFIATCEGQLRTYHVWLPERLLLVSVSSLGDRRLGELLLGGIRD